MGTRETICPLAVMPPFLPTVPAKLHAHLFESNQRKLPSFRYAPVAGVKKAQASKHCPRLWPSRPPPASAVSKSNFPARLMVLASYMVLFSLLARETQSGPWQAAAQVVAAAPPPAALPAACALRHTSREAVALSLSSQGSSTHYYCSQTVKSRQS